MNKRLSHLLSAIGAILGLMAYFALLVYLPPQPDLVTLSDCKAGENQDRELAGICEQLTHR